MFTIKVFQDGEEALVRAHWAYRMCCRVIEWTTWFLGILNLWGGIVVTLKENACAHIFSRFLIIPPRVLCPGGRASGFIFPWTLAPTFCPIIHVSYAYVSYMGRIVFAN